MIAIDNTPWEILSWAGSGLAHAAAMASDRKVKSLRRNTAAAMWAARREAKRTMEHGQLLLSRVYCRHRRHQRFIRGESTSAAATT